MAPHHLFIIFTLLLFITATSTTSEARDFLVGGSSDAWKIPSPASPTLNQWAEATRFQVGDSLVWNLKGKEDSVLQVSREDYSACTTSNPIAERRGDTVTVKLEKSGPYYFVSGEGGACEKGEKVAVVVMGERKRRPHYEFFAAGGPSPAEAPAVIGAEEGTASAPTSGGGRNLVGAASFAVMLLGVGLVLRG